MKQISFTIDGRPVTAERGVTVLRAALSAGIYIPHMCWAEGLLPYGACRMCIVKIEGMRGFPTACTTTVAEGMKVLSDVDEVNAVRRMICEMIIADHPMVCLTCVANQDCELQDVAAYLGVQESRLRRITRKTTPDDTNPFYMRDMSKCILCGQCTRACRELRGIGAIEIAGRGFESRIAAQFDKPIIESTCVSCGECVDRCPVAALYAKNETIPPAAETATICPYCGCGCALVLGTRSGRLVRVRGDRNNPVNRGSLCVKGRFGLDFITAKDRLKTPLIKRDGEFKDATWDEALDHVARRLREIREKHGPDAIAVLSSAKCTNEENYAMQKFVRAAIGTNNIDHCARLCHASTVAGLAKAFGSGAMTNSIDELEHADCIFVTGSNTTEAHPIIAMRIMAAAMNHGAKVIIADPREIDLVKFAHMHIRQRSGTDVALFNAMLQVIISENLHDRDFVASRTEGFDEVEKCVRECTPEWAAPVTGIPAEDIRRFARTYAAAERGSIVYSMGITQHTTGTDNVLALANLAMLTGNIGRFATGVNPLRGHNNVQGSCDMGALPNLYPGYQAVTDPKIKEKFEKAWGVHLSDKPGLTVTEIIHGAGEGKIKGLYIMGENPMISDPNLNQVRKALQKTDFLCVQDIFLTETAQLAEVVLPGVAFAEKDGTFTNTERRIQRIRKALEAPGSARQDWGIIAELSTRLGHDMRYASASEIMDEAASVTPIYGGVSFQRLEGTGLQWPCPTFEHPGTPLLHQDKFTRGLGKFHPTPFRSAAELPDRDYPYILTTGRYLYQFHTGTMTRRTKGLDQLCPPVPVEINPGDAAREGISNGDAVRISSRRGALSATAVVTERSPSGTVFMAFHFWEAAANLLTNDAVDPVAKIPEYKICAVTMSKQPAA